MALARWHNARPGSSWDLANSGSFGNFFREFDQLFQEMTAPIQQSQWVNSYPADLYETGETLVLEMAVPGIKVDDLEVSIEGNQLSIQGSYPNFSDNQEQRRYWLQSIPRGQFTRTVTLPAAVEADNVTATVHDGLLTLTLPKVEHARSRKIAISQG